ncbi:MAG TPA: ribonuclease III [Spirochaetia bacterium]|nr:ribonuclease III [Spirochaetia bacterium]
MELFGKPRSPSISGLKPERKKLLKQFEKSSGVRFKNEALLDLAFSHRSYSNENADHRDNNERLEFLGDSVLGLVVSSYLYHVLSDRAEGDLAKIKSFVVSEEILSGLAKNLGIDQLLLIGKGEENSGGRTKKALLADSLEAVFGAYYLDAGFPEVQKFILQLLVPEINSVLENRHKKDYKTLLQELVQKTHRSYPRYVLVDKTGPDHDKTFFMEVQVNGQSLGSGSGKNKKEAEQEAAGIAFQALTEGGAASPGAGSKR